jgi:hypothetical protein
METFNNGKPIRRIIERKADGTIIGWANVDLYDGTDSDMTTADKFRPSDFVSKTNGGADKSEVTLWEDLEVAEIYSWILFVSHQTALHAHRLNPSLFDAYEHRRYR